MSGNKNNNNNNNKDNNNNNINNNNNNKSSKRDLQNKTIIDSDHISDKDETIKKKDSWSLTTYTNTTYSICMMEFSKQTDVKFLKTIPYPIRPFIAFTSRDKYGNTALMASILYHQTEAFHYLLNLIPLDKMKQYLNHQNVHGHTAIHLTLFYRKQNLLKELLRNSGADENVLDAQMRNIYHFIAAEDLSPQYITCVLKSLQEKNRSNPIDAHLQLLSTYDAEGRTPLHIAIQTQRLSLINTFLHPAIDQNQCFDWSPSQIDKLMQVLRQPELKTGNTPLMLAVMAEDKYFFDIICQQFTDMEDDENLKEYLNEQNYSGNTALHLAAAYNRKHMCDILIEKGSYPFIYNYEDLDYSHYFSTENE